MRLEGGETEENYIATLWQRLRWLPDAVTTRFVNVKGQGGISGWIGRSNLDAYAEIAVVIDTETHPHTELATSARALQTAPDWIEVYLSAPSVEAWLLAHYQEVPTSKKAIFSEIARIRYSKPRLPAGMAQHVLNFDEAQQRLPIWDPLDVAELLQRVAVIPARTTECDFCEIGSSLGFLAARMAGRTFGGGA